MRSFALCTAFLAVVSACGGADSDQAAPPGTTARYASMRPVVPPERPLERTFVTVVDGDTGKPVRGAEVAVAGGRSRTDAAGRATVARLDRRHFGVRLEATGYIARKTRVSAGRRALRFTLFKRASQWPIYGVTPSSMRRHPRAALDAAAQLTAVGDGRVCRARTFDISEGGLGLVGVPDDWTVGSKVEVRLDGGEVGRRIVAEGTIVSRRGDKAGLQFTALDDASAPAVAEYVARGRDRDEIDEPEADVSRR